MPNLFYFNATFDLSLGSYPTDSVKRASAEMTALFIPAGNMNDRTLIDVTIREDYFEYLDKKGLEHSLPFSKEKNSECFTAEPWGWDANSLQRFLEIGVSANHPDFAIVKMLNNRHFCYECTAPLGYGVRGSSWFDQPDLAIDFLNHLTNFPVVIKPAFGGSGFGFCVIEKLNHITPQMIERIRTLCLHGGMIIEPWCKRVYDISTSFLIDKSGGITNVNHYQCHVNANGAFYGVYLGHNEMVDRWKQNLEKAAEQIANQIVPTGYYGPIGFDSFVYTTETNDLKLAPVIEINARHIMSDIARSIKQKFSPGKNSYLRFISKRRCRLPESYILWEEIASEARSRFSTDILLITPLRVDHGNSWVIPERNGFLLSSDTSEQIFAADQWLRDQLYKN